LGSRGSSRSVDHFSLVPNTDSLLAVPTLPDSGNTTLVDGSGAVVVPVAPRPEQAETLRANNKRPNWMSVHLGSQNRAYHVLDAALASLDGGRSTRDWNDPIV
jgi:hypothetical protein